MSTLPPYWFLFRTQSHLASEAHARGHNTHFAFLEYTRLESKTTKTRSSCFVFCGLLQSPSYADLRKTYILISVGTCSWNFNVFFFFFFGGGAGGGIQPSKDDSIRSLWRTIIQGGKAQVQEVGGHAAEDQIQIRTSSWLINHQGSVHTKFYSRDWSIQSIIY